MSSNDVWEVFEVLGVEACVHVLFEQLRRVISYDGGYVDDRHIQLICDVMCHKGR